MQSALGQLRARAAAAARAAARRARADPLATIVSVAAVLASLWVVGAPFWACRYPPITDLPFHGASSSALRHYLDPAWHFREQFTLQPLAVPYMSMYALAAAFMLVLPAVAATKLAAAVMLALLPAGLAVQAWGMKKSPLLGLCALPLCWCNLAHWGFFNFLGALGLFAMVVGLTLRLLDAPSRRRAVLLGVVLVALFFTHVFRFPFAIAAVVGATLVLWPATRRARPVLVPLLVAVAMLLLWMRVRTDALRADLGPLVVHKERLAELGGLLFGGIADAGEGRAVALAWRIALGVGLASIVARVVEDRDAERPRPPWRWELGAAAVVICCAGVFLGLFLVLPMQMGAWWYVYPREATAAVFVAIGVLPDLPRSPILKTLCAVALAVPGLAMSAVVVRAYRAFDGSTADFHAITRALPQAPRLLYLVFDHGGSTRTTTPFIHLPAWVQAERGGWLSFHFAVWNATPVAYRARDEAGAVVPPAVPLRWEWTPQVFDARRNGAFFDWFLVRQRNAPDRLFAADPTIKRVDHVGTWWLYHREGVTPPGDGSAGW